jgi:lipid-A-disaccharide synthase-like uncharacterized protein
MTSIGLIMIAVAWLIQFLLMTKKDRSVQNLFLFIYGLGSLVLVYDAYILGVGVKRFGSTSEARES